MTPDDPRHGTNAGHRAHFEDGEDSCDPCRTARNAYEDNRHRQKAYGRWNPFTDAEPVRQHVRELMAGGMSIKRIAGSAQVEWPRVGYLIYGRGGKGPPVKVRPDFATAVLAVELNPYAVPIYRVQRRVQALIALGYTQPWIAEQIGVTQARIWQFIRGRQEHVTPDTFEKVDDLYRRFSMTLPPTTTKREKYAASRARETATRNRYRPPLAWDDIDNPDEKPCRGRDLTHSHDEVDPVVVQRFLEGDWGIRTTKAERFEITARWLDRGRSLADLERATGWRAERYVTREDGAA